MQNNIVNTIWDKQGWLFNLTVHQYMMMAGLIVVVFVAWALIAFINKTKGRKITSWWINFIVWNLRILLLLSFGYGLFLILDISLSSFISLPVFILFGEIQVSPLLVGSIILGFYLLVSTNHFFKRLVVKISDKYEIDSNIGKQVRRFLMVFILVAIGSIWIKLAGAFLVDFFDQKIIEISSVKITPWVFIYATIILYGISVALKLFEFLITRVAKSKGLNTSQSRTFFQILKYAIWVVSIVLLLDSIGVSITMIVASSAALLVGLGFGIQGLFNDMISGFVLLFEGSIKVDDVVEIESSIIGRVKEVGIRTSKILTRDNITMIIPNHKFVSENVINWSYNQPKTRFSVDVGVSYGSDVRLVEQLLLECATECSDVLKNPEPLVYFRDFGNSALDFRLIFWIEEVFIVELIKSHLRFAIDKKFRENNVTIPFPQMDLHLKSGFRKGEF